MYMKFVLVLFRKHEKSFSTTGGLEFFHVSMYKFIELMRSDNKREQFRLMAYSNLLISL